MKQDILITDLNLIASKLNVKLKQLNTLEYELEEIKAVLTKTNKTQQLLNSNLQKLLRLIT